MGALEKVVKESFRKVRGFTIYKTDKQIIFRKSLSLKLEARKKVLWNFIFLTNQLHILRIALSNNNYGRKKSNTADSALKFSTEIDISY